MKDHTDIARRLNFLYEFIKGSRNGELTKGDWADEIGVGSSALSNWLSGARRPKPDEAIRLHELYGVSLDFIYIGRLDMLPYKMVEALKLKSLDK